MKILVIQKKRIGDVLTSTILLEALKEKFPQSELHYLIYPNSIAVVEKNPFVDKIIVLDNLAKNKTSKFIDLLYQIRKEKYNVVVDAYGKPNSVIIGWFSGAKKTITFDKIYSRILYSNVINRNENSFSNATKAIEHRMKLLKPLGIDFKELKPKIFLTSNEILIAKNSLITQGIDFLKPLVMISAIGSNEAKTYPLEYMAQVLNKISSTNETQILFNYLPYQKELATRLCNLCDLDTQKKIFLDIYENNLRQFLALTKNCNALIGNEGGATNMAKALDIPTFTIYAPGVVKTDWNMFENQDTNISVHVNDYLTTENFDHHVLSEKFNPELFEDKLNHFLKINCN